MPDTKPLNAQADDQKLLAQVVSFYHETLKNSENALGYLRKRGITNSQVIDQFRIGFANRTLGLTLPSKQLKAGRERRTATPTRRRPTSRRSRSSRDWRAPDC